jgi:DNA-binding MurR/RpiR family transcriptional regulator
VIARVRALLPSLPPAHAKVARAVLDDPPAVIHWTVSDAAALTGTSSATIVRACQQLGFRGFHDLKLALAQETAPMRQAVPGAIDELDSPAIVLRKVLTFDGEAIEDSLATIDEAAFTAAVDLLDGARRVLIVGVGTSAPLAQDASYRLLTIGVRSEAPADVHVQHVAATLLEPGDACIAISHTGQTRETIATVTAARDAGAGTVCVTSFSRSPLIDIVDTALVAGSRETSFRLEAMASRIAHLCVLDALYVALALRRPERARLALEATGRAITGHRY